MAARVEFGDQLFGQLLDSAPDPTLVVDAAGTIVLVNQQVERVFGYDRNDLVGRPIEVLVPERFRPGHPDKRNGFLANPGERPLSMAAEVQILHSDGHESPVEIALSPLDTEEGLLVTAAIRDLSERHRLLQEAERMREEIIATVSHELRTPLTSIIGYTELLSDLDEMDLSARARKLVNVIERNAARELRLVDDLLTMAFLDGKMLRIALGPVDLVGVARRVCTDLRPRARERGIRFGFEGEEDLPAVRGDFYRLVQVLENLVTNACKFTQPGGSVTVRVRRGASAGVLQVVDTGSGLDPEERSRVFERLYRAPTAVAAQVQGAGLGLSIVQKIVEGHHGRVEVDSEVGRGTTFTVRIPYAEAPSEEREAPGALEVPVPAPEEASR